MFENDTSINRGEGKDEMMEKVDEMIAREKSMDQDKLREVSNQLGSVVLLNDMEKAKADGIKAQIGVYLRYVLQNESSEVSPKEAISIFMKELKDYYNSLSSTEKVASILFAPVQLPLAIGVGSAILGVRSIEFLNKLKEGSQVLKNSRGMEWQGSVDEMIKEADKGNYTVNPYQENNIHPSVEDFVDNDTYYKGGR